MATSNHHIAMRVEDLGRSVAFYESAFGARKLLDAFEVDGELAAVVTGGPPGTTMTIQQMGFDEGGALELYEFSSPVHPTKPISFVSGNFLHFAIQVEGTDEALEAALAAGATQLWPEVMEIGHLRMIYVGDPDGNVIELVDGSVAESVEISKKLFAGGA